MRTNIEIDDKLMRRAMRVSGAKTKKNAVEEAMRLTVRLDRQAGILELFGKVRWEGDLAAMREARFPDWEEMRAETATRKKFARTQAPAMTNASECGR